MRRLPLALLALLPTCVPAAAAPVPHKRSGHTIFQSRHLWATVDICNTPAHPRTIGVRASMPGSGDAGEQMFMRFQIQYRRRADGVWLFVGPSADTGFVPVGSSTFKARQAGHSFSIAPPNSYVLRGVVNFEWRRGSHVVRHARKATSAGHATGPAADPPGYSAAACELP
jgi:hypothetical protein